MLKKLCIGALVSVFLGTVNMATPAAAGTKDVVVIGNSILGLSNEELIPKLEARGWTVHLEWVNGSGLTVGANTNTPYDWQSRLTELERLYNPYMVVIELGTNDALSVNLGEPFEPHITRLLAATDAPQVRWATCSTRTFDPNRNNGCATINTNLQAVTREGYKVIPYEPEATTDPRFGTTDTVHPNADGQVVTAEVFDKYIGSPK